MNDNLKTIIIAPITSQERYIPIRIKVNIREKVGYVMLDQIKAVDKLRLQGKPIGKMKSEQITELKKTSLKC